MSPEPTVTVRTLWAVRMGPAQVGPPYAEDDYHTDGGENMARATVAAYPDEAILIQQKVITIEMPWEAAT